MPFSISDWLNIIGKLSVFVPIPGAALTGKLAAIVGEMIEAERARSGKTTEQILTEAGLQQEATAALLEQELARLDALDTQPLEE
jgi:hypothetical protein